MHVLILRPYRKENIYFRTIEEREKINEFLFRSVFLLSIIGSSSQSFSMLISFLAHLSRRLRGELIVYRSSRRPSVRPCVRACVRVFTLSKMNISETNGSIATKFYLKHHLGGGLAALGFGPDRIRTLVSMATESSHRVIMVKTVHPLFLGCFSSDPFHTCR